MSTLHLKFPLYLQLIRWDKPVGSLLLLWPTLAALWIAAGGFPGWHLLAVFTLGTFLMRSAGCVINDLADRHIDGHVKRTAARPLATGAASRKEALALFGVLCLLSAVLVLFTNRLTVLLAFPALALAACYPLAKRYTHLPQVVLGAAFGWSIPMAFAAVEGELTRGAWLVFTANMFWTVAYDTYYAMVDRDDDLKIGVKSTAILFGEDDRLIIAILQACTLLTLALVGRYYALGYWYYIGLLGAAGWFIWQYLITRHRERDACFRAFLNNNWAGATVFAGILVHYLSAG